MHHLIVFILPFWIWTQGITLQHSAIIIRSNLWLLIEVNQVLFIILSLDREWAFYLSDSGNVWSNTTTLIPQLNLFCRPILFQLIPIRFICNLSLWPNEATSIIFLTNFIQILIRFDQHFPLVLFDTIFAGEVAGMSVDVGVLLIRANNTHLLLVHTNTAHTNRILLGSFRKVALIPSYGS